MSPPSTSRFLRGLKSAALALPLAALPFAAMAYPATTGMPIVKRPHFAVLAHIPLPGPVRWDYAAFEPDTNHLFVTQGTQLDVINAAAHQKIQTIKGLDGIHGVAFAPKLDQGFISDGKAGEVRIFGLDTFKLVGSVKVDSGKSIAHLPLTGFSDAVRYGPTLNLVFAPSIDGKLAVIGAGSSTGADHYKILQTVATAPGARTEAIDQRGPYLFLPAAKATGRKSATGSGHHARMNFAPGSFGVIVIGPQGLAG